MAKTALPLSLVPMIHVPDVAATVAWYETIGFETVDVHRDGEELTWALMLFGDGRVMFNAGGQESPAPRREADLYVRVDGVDEFFRCLPEGVDVEREPYDACHGMRELILRDLNGFWVTFGEAISGASERSTLDAAIRAGENDRQKIERLGKRSFWQRLQDRLYGYDFFISYRWSDGREYAIALAEKLEAAGLDFFLDSEDYKPGQNWLLAGRSAIRNTSRLVLVASEGAIEDPEGRGELEDPILNELRAFDQGERQKVRIFISPRVEKRWPGSPASAFFDEKDLFIRDVDREMDSVIAELVRWSRMDRRDRRRLRFFQLVASVLFALTAIAVALGWIVQMSSERLKVAAAETLFRSGSEELRKGNARQAVRDFASAVELQPGDQMLVDRLYSTLTQRPPQWVLQRRHELPERGMEEVVGLDVAETWRALTGETLWVPEAKSVAGPVSGRAPVAEEGGEGLGPDGALENELAHNDGYDEDDEDAPRIEVFTAPNGTWSVESHYFFGKFQPGHPFYYELHFPRDGSHRLEEFVEIGEPIFDRRSAYWAVIQSSDEILVVGRDGSISAYEHDNVSDIGFAEESSLLFSVAQSEIRFWNLGASTAGGKALRTPEPLFLESSPGDLKLARGESSWLLLERRKGELLLWTYPIEWQPPGAEIHEVPVRPWPDCQERARSSLNGAWRLREMASGWRVEGAEGIESQWPELEHPLGEEDEEQKWRQDETYDSTTALIVKEAAISGDGRVVVTAAGRSDLKVWRQQGHVDSLSVGAGRYVQGLKLDETGDRVFVYFSTERQQDPYGLFPTAGGTALGGGSLKRETEILDIALDGGRILVKAPEEAGGALEVRDLESGWVLGNPLEIEGLTYASFSPDGLRFVAATESGTVQVFDVERQDPITEPFIFPEPRAGSSFGIPQISQRGDVLLRELGQPARLAVWRSRLEVSKAGANELAALSRFYYGVGGAQRRPSEDLRQRFGADRESPIASLSEDLFQEVLPID